jgi:hypothetical protein
VSSPTVHDPVVRTERFASARHVADAVLYEGYVLYPYRASAQKNQLRWQFGVLAPPDYARSSGSERSTMCTEVIVDPGDRPRLTVRIRCLQAQHRIVEATADGGATYSPVDALLVGGASIVPWDEAVEHEIDLDVVDLTPADQPAREHRVTLPAGDDIELLRNHRGDIVGRALQRREQIEGLVRTSIRGADASGDLVKVSIGVENTTEWLDGGATRDTAMQR